METIGDGKCSDPCLLCKHLKSFSTHYLVCLFFLNIAYMAVTNLVKDQHDDHTARIAQFAIEAIKAANGTQIDLEDESLGCVNIRVGK